MAKNFPIYAQLEESEYTGDFYVKGSDGRYMEYSDFFKYGGQSYSHADLVTPYIDDPDTSYSLQLVGYAANYDDAYSVVIISYIIEV